MNVKKNRRDLYYFLSKKYYFRSRAAFKLIELNKKFQFLNNSNGILDLCAAPGGWLQVAQKIASPNSLIIGIDAKNIFPIKGCNTIKGDITTDGCLTHINKLKKWKKKTIDVVLHDGAPRMGSAWLRDSLNQNDLVLSAFKVAVTCLVKKGWFVSKIFSSGNFHGLLYVFRCFFRKVNICKPKACRKTSAETYVICKGFNKPSNFDQNLLEKKFIFGTTDYKKKKILPMSNRYNKWSVCNKLNFLCFFRGESTIYDRPTNALYLSDEMFCIWGLSFYGKTSFFKKMNAINTSLSKNGFFITILRLMQILKNKNF